MKKFFIGILFLILTITPVYASSYDLFRADDNVNVNEDLDGTSFIAGQSVDIDSNVNGILFTAGNYVNVTSNSDYLFTAGNVLKVDEGSYTDAFIAGSNINITSTNIKRDIYVAGDFIEVNGTVGRNSFLAGKVVKIDGTFTGNVTINADEIVVGNNAKIDGTLKHNDDAKVTISDTAVINKITKEKRVTISINKKAFIIGKVTSLIISYINILFIGLLMLVFAPKLFEKISKMDKNSILSNLGIGLISLFFIPVASILILFTMVGLSVGIISLILYFVLLYLSTVISSYYLGNLFLSNKIKNKYALLTISITIVYLLKLIPFIGTLVSLVSVCLGLGIVVINIFKRNS